MEREILKNYKPKLKEGDIFNNLIAIKYVGHRRTKKGLVSQWLFKCNCGEECIKDDIQVRRGHTKSCNRSYVNFIGEGIALENKLYDTYKRHAINRNIEFNISKEDFINLTKCNCEYCGISPIQEYRSKLKIKQKPLLYNGVDRIDNTKGYSKENCVSCCKRCNISKNNMTIEEFKNWIFSLINNQSKLIF